ncbi:MAG: translocation/assembly module TamB domain-containing protein [Verrucomicrobiota bacterium]
MSSSSDSPSPPRRYRKRWYATKRFRFSALALVLSLWINGPGIRWILETYTLSLVKKQGLEGTLDFSGWLHSGLGLRDVRLVGQGEVRQVRIERLQLNWRLWEIVTGQLRAVTAQGLHFAGHLPAGKKEPALAEEATPPPDPRETVTALLKTLSSRLGPLQLDLQDLSCHLTQGQDQVWQLASTSLRHESGSRQVLLELGEFRYPGGQPLPAQTIRLTLAEERFSLDRMQLPGAWVLEQFELTAPSPEALTTSLDLRYGQSTLLLQSSDGFDKALCQLSGPPFPLSRALSEFGIQDVRGQIDSLRLVATGLFPDLGQARAEARLAASGLGYQEWEAPELSLAGTLAGKDLDGRLEALFEDIPLTLTASGNLAQQVARLRLQLPTLQKVQDWVGRRFLDLSPTPPPLLGQGELLAQVRWGETIHLPEASLALTSLSVDGSPLSPLTLSGSFQNPEEYAGALQLGRPDETLLQASFSQSAAGYTAQMALLEKGWPILRQLATAFGANALPEGDLLLSFEGSGHLAGGRHRGQLSASSPSLTLATDLSPSLGLEAEFDWPRSATIHSLQVGLEPGTLSLAGRWSEDRLRLSQVEATLADGSLLLQASASLPCALDATTLDRFLSQEGDLDLQVKVPPGANARWAQLAPTLPALTGTGGLQLALGGTWSRPEIDGSLDLRQIALPEKPEIPPSDLFFALQTSPAGDLQVTGRAQADRLPPLTLEGRFPLRPLDWVPGDQSLANSPIDLSLQLPRVELAVFHGLAPQLESLSGSAELQLRARGTVAEPLLTGFVKAEDLAYRSDLESITDVTDGDLHLLLDDRQIEIAEWVIRGAGGRMEITGGGDFTDLADPAFDLTLLGDHLLLWRDEIVSARANTRLRLAGRLSESLLSGRLALVESLLFKDINLIPSGPAFGLPSQPSLPAIQGPPPPSSDPPPFLAGCRLDVQVLTEDPLLIRGNRIRGRITSSLQVGGTLAEPLPDGSIRLENVSAQLPFSPLELKRGLLTFSPEEGFLPRLQLRASSELKPYLINIFVDGPATSPEFTLTSAPPLPESEIMTLLATGTTTDGLTDRDAVSAKALQFLIEELRQGSFPYGGLLSQLLEPFRDVQLRVGAENPYSGQSSSSATVEITENLQVTGAISDENSPRGVLTYLFRFR